jgi:Putative abortive phage resistance protein AbiGi, antitoxin
MAENVSSKVLFHFTNSIYNLKNILKDGFFPHYCPEYTLNPVDQKEASKGCSPLQAIPLVSFCDLPLSLIRKHLKEYGNFGIGLNKKWGIRKGVAPVIYTHRKAQTCKPIMYLNTKEANDNKKIVADDLNLLATYTKPFKGHAWRDEQVKRNVIFYDEREWRYVPRGIKPLFLKRDDYAIISKTTALHKRFKEKYTLAIPPDDIQYLIVQYDKDENNILELHDYIMRLYGRRYSRKDAILVTTAIMTDDCIKEDI